MKLKNFFYILSFLLLLNLKSKAMDGSKEFLPKYTGIYTTKIYDQSDIEFPETYTALEYRKDKETKKAIKAKLYELKEAHVNMRCIKVLDEQLQQMKVSLDEIKGVLDEVVNQNKDHQNSGSWIKSGLEVGAAAAGWFFGGPIVAGLANSLGSQITRTASDSLKSSTSKSLGKKSIDAQIKIQESESIKQEIRKADLMRQSYLNGIKQEPKTLLNMEKEYLYKKKFLPVKLQQRIEAAFLEARAIVFSHFENAESFLTMALRFPIIYQDLSLTFSNESILCQLFDRNVFFSRFDDEVRKNLKKVAYDIFLLSKSEGRLQRKSYYFWGAPGIGKSCAGREIAAFLEKPCYEMSVRSKEDLSQSSMEGSPRSWQGSNLGYLSEALLVPDNEENTYKGPFLIINDFDRVFLDNSPTALSFLLHYLDPNTESYQSKYFGCPVDITQSVIIITGNQKIPDDEKYDALRERLEEVEFGALPQTSYQSILEEYRDDFLDTIQITDEMGINTDEEIQKITEEGSSSIREKKRTLRNFMTLEKLNYLEKQLAKNQNQRLKQKKRNKHMLQSKKNSSAKRIRRR